MIDAFGLHAQRMLVGAFRNVGAAADQALQGRRSRCEGLGIDASVLPVRNICG